MELSLIDQPIVDLVGEYEEPFVAGQPADSLQLLARVHGARGVTGIVDDDHTGLFADACRKVLNIQLKTSFGAKGKQHRHGPA